MSSVIYLDHNATTPPLPEVVDVVAQVMRDCYGNPGSRHKEGRKARRVLEESRETIAQILGADPSELVFTSGGTEANNMALRGLTNRPRATIAISPGEHPSTLEVCRDLNVRGWQLHRLPVDGSGRLVINGLPEETAVVAIILAHNETGVVQEIDTLIRDCRGQSIPVHLDAVQAVGKIPVNFRELGATTLSFGAHKFHGPRGVGGLLIQSGVRIPSLLLGGHQEQEHRAGTEPVALVAGMAKALQLWSRDHEIRTTRISQLRDQFQAMLLERCLPAVVNSVDAPRLPNTLNISFPGVDGEALLVALDLEGICCSLGTTCASGSSEPAPILVAMGLSADLYRSAVRFSLSFLNTSQELAQAVERISRVVANIRKS